MRSILDLFRREHPPAPPSLEATGWLPPRPIPLDIEAPLTEFERVFLQRVMSQPMELPEVFREWLLDYVALSVSVNIEGGRLEVWNGESS